MKPVARVACWGVILACVMGMSSAQPKPMPDDFRAAILSARAAWNKAMVERNTEALGKLVAPDFQSIGGNGITSGITGVKAGYANLFKHRPDVFFERKAVHVEGEDRFDLAFEEGTWVERWTEADGPTELQGSYFVMWRLINGEWKQQADVFVPSHCIGKSYCAPQEPFKIPAISKALVSAYAGWYQLSDGSVLEIRPEEDYLVARGRFISERALQPVSDNEFLRGSWKLRFSPSSSNGMGVELLQDGQLRTNGWKLQPSAQPKP